MNIYLYVSSKFRPLTCMFQVSSGHLPVCFRYSDFRLVDIPALQKRIPLTLSSFTHLVKTSSQRGKDVLRNQWIKDCCNIVNDRRDEIEAWMPADQVRQLPSSLYAAVIYS